MNITSFRDCFDHPSFAWHISTSVRFSAISFSSKAAVKKMIHTTAVASPSPYDHYPHDVQSVNDGASRSVEIGLQRSGVHIDLGIKIRYMITRFCYNDFVTDSYSG